MNMHKDLLSKLAQGIEQIPRDVLYDFCCSYAELREEGGCLMGDVRSTRYGNNK